MRAHFGYLALPTMQLSHEHDGGCRRTSVQLTTAAFFIALNFLQLFLLCIHRRAAVTHDSEVISSTVPILILQHFFGLCMFQRLCRDQLIRVPKAGSTEASVIARVLGGCKPYGPCCSMRYNMPGRPPACPTNDLEYCPAVRDRVCSRLLFRLLLLFMLMGV